MFTLVVSVVFAGAQTSAGIKDTTFAIDSVLGIVNASVVKNYRYIRFSKNKIDLPGDKSNLINFYRSFDSLTKLQDRQLVVYHFGGSHIQADIYSNEVRNYLQEFDTCMRGPRGWIFPFSAARTNNPPNYRTEFSGNWISVRSPVKKDSSKILGLAGISVTAKDSFSTMKLYAARDSFPFQFTGVRVYYNIHQTNYSVRFGDSLKVFQVRNDTAHGFTEFQFDSMHDTVTLTFERMNADTTLPITLYGMLLLNAEPGIVYNSIGVNGAGFESYERCQLFEEQISQLPPDLVIISIGTNDANDTGFTPKEFADNYIRFVESIKSINPGCAFIFTVPNDNYYRYRYPQKNIAKCKAVIYSMAEKFHAGVWNFYDIMGGYASSQKWYRNHLMKRDRIHFTGEGYKIKGDLFYEAFLKWYAELKYLDEHHLTRQ